MKKEKMKAGMGKTGAGKSMGKAKGITLGPANQLRGIAAKGK